MSFVPPWETEFDECYWNAIVMQGQWAHCSPPLESDSFLPTTTLLT